VITSNIKGVASLLVYNSAKNKNQILLFLPFFCKVLDQLDNMILIGVLCDQVDLHGWLYSVFRSYSSL